MKNLLRRITIVTIIITALFGFKSFAADSQATEAFNKVNEIRVANGLAPITWDVQIEQAGDVRATEAAVSFSHTRPDGSDWYTANDDVLYGENLAKLYDNSSDVVTAWMNSPEHKANILNGEFKTGAISVYSVGGELYWAQEFGY